MSVRALLASLILAASLLGQTPGRIPGQFPEGAPGQLTLEAIAHPTKKVTYAGMPTTRLDWLPDGALVQTRREGDQVTLLRVDPATWASTPLLEAGRLQAALVAAGAADLAAKAALGRGGFIWNEERSAFLLEAAGDLFQVEVKAARAKRIASGKVDEPTFSPDGRQVAYLRGNDLYRAEVATGRETRLTTGGSETVFNGRLDWVYQEEVYGRGSFRAFWWAPDSRRIAYLQLDETKVPVFTLMDDRHQPQKAQAARYPKAGDPNPVARLGVVELDGRTAWMEDPYPGQETLIVQVGWDPLGHLLAIHQDRIQSWLDLRRYEATGSKRLLHENGLAWQERLPLPHFLPDGGFLWESGRTGHHHVYRYGKDGNLAGAVTAGDWDVKRVHGVDAKTGHLYFDATERSPIGLDAYRIGLDGKGLGRLTERPGTHRARFNPAFTAFLDVWSDVQTPPQQALHDGSGKQLRLIDANPSEAWKALKRGKVSFQQVKTRDGFPMETMLVLPPGFDPSRRYPVFQEIYGGPATPTVRNAWGRDMLWYQFLAQQGIVVWACDNRSASAKGLASAYGIHRNLGAQELQDQLDGHAWLKQQGWADLDRLCLDGWSYGGFMVTYALTHSKAWKLGIAGAPVTDWRLYDSIYTERYMGLPSDNKAGYEASSVVKAAGNLSGRLLLLHGTLDDNVHPQNSVMLIDALQKAGHPVQLVLLPGSDHVPRAPQHAWARFQAMWDFISKNL
ncbi:peptidase S9 [Geothrix oryzae]|uniref:Peptidase S9 n=1 Tax=Geothrix oryzae TaxID=2927975 RepID=A0ABM8DQ59_9BACT|nr:S9 family peptidase [Geothrix oryzae]BDU69114.1 peptidase S9 [Geothrix oryzae]